MKFDIRRQGLIGKLSLLATLTLLSACAPQQDMSWASSGLSTGKVGVMGPSGPIGP